MKYTSLLLSCFVFAMLTTTCIAHGHEDVALNDDKPVEGRRMEERKEMMEKKFEERKDLTKEKNGELRNGTTRFDEFKKQRVGGMMTMMKTRFEWAIDRLENIADRIETRIEKVEDENGTALTDARMHLDEARTNIADATRLLGEINTDVHYITDDEAKTDERFSGFRTAFGNVKTEIKSAWMHLREALQAIKGEHKNDTNEESADTSGIMNY